MFGRGGVDVAGQRGNQHALIERSGPYRDINKYANILREIKTKLLAVREQI